MSIPGLLPFVVQCDRRGVGSTAITLENNKNNDSGTGAAEAIPR